MGLRGRGRCSATESAALRRSKARRGPQAIRRPGLSARAAAAGSAHDLVLPSGGPGDVRLRRCRCQLDEQPGSERPARPEHDDSVAPARARGGWFGATAERVRGDASGPGGLL